MFSDDLGDRTMPPTERRRRETRKRGEVAKSSQWPSAIVLLAASGLLWSLDFSATNPLVLLMRNGLTTEPRISMSIDSTTEMVGSATQTFVATVWPFLLVLLVSGLLANLTQLGWLWIPARVLPQFRRSPLFSWDRIADAAGLILRVGCLVGLTFRFIVAHDWQLFSLGLNQPGLMLVHSVQLLAELCLQLSSCLIGLAVVDYGYRYWRHEQNLKMSVEDLRREQREDAIAPQIKRKRSELHRL